MSRPIVPGAARVSRRRTTKRPGYREAVAWVAWNDNAGDGDSEADLVGYVTVGLIADLFGADQEAVARDVARERRRAGIKVRKEGERWA